MIKNNPAEYVTVGMIQDQNRKAMLEARAIRSTTEATGPQLSALKWLKNRGSDGVFDRHNVLTASGERGPIMRSTWTRLEALGLVERYLNNRRLRVTEAGQKINLSNVRESEG